MIFRNWLMVGLFASIGINGSVVAAESNNVQNKIAATETAKPPKSGTSATQAKKKDSNKASRASAAQLDAPKKPADPVLSAKQAAEQWKVQREAVLDGMDGERE